MASFKRFEDIQAWQKARQVTKIIYQVAAAAEKFSRDFGLRDQLRSASISIMANIAEGHGRRTNKDFASFLTMSHGSAAEVQSHLYVALDLGYIDKQTFTEIYRVVDEISKMTFALSRHLLSH